MNYTVKRYFFEQSAVREFYSGAYYDLFLVMRGSGVFRCSEVVLPAQQQNLIIFQPGQGARRWRSFRTRTPTLKKASTWCPSGRWLCARTARSICC